MIIFPIQEVRYVFSRIKTSPDLFCAEKIEMQRREAGMRKDNSKMRL